VSFQRKDKIEDNVNVKVVKDQKKEEIGLKRENFLFMRWAEFKIHGPSGTKVLPSS
jgi:phosphoenolpyruvate-protein kinase (PTS system EI component)